MSIPNIPNITPLISITTGQTVPLLLSSIALEELALAHIMNSEAEKIQLVTGTLPSGVTLSPPIVSLADLLAVDTSVQRTLRDVIKKEMLLEFKFENILELISLTQVVTPPTPPTAPCGCQVTNTAGGPFDITRGVGAADVTLDGTPLSGSIALTGLICSSCSPTSNFFTFTFNPSGGGNTSTFTATTFTVPHCPGNATVTISGQGTLTGPLAAILGPSPTYTLTVIEPNFISLTLTGNGLVLTATVTNLGVGEVVLSNCP